MTTITEFDFVKHNFSQADPWICGHRGHATTSCGYSFKRYFELGQDGRAKAKETLWGGPKVGQVL